MASDDESVSRPHSDDVEYHKRLIAFQDSLDLNTVEALLKVISRDTPDKTGADLKYSFSVAFGQYDEYRNLVKKPFKESLNAAIEMIEARLKVPDDHKLELKRASLLLRKLYALTTCIHHTEDHIKWIKENTSLLSQKST